MKTKTVIKLNSDNFENTLMTFEVYSEIRLQMSSGDFGCHGYEIVNVPEEFPVIIGFSDFDNMPVYDTE